MQSGASPALSLWSVYMQSGASPALSLWSVYMQSGASPALSLQLMTRTFAAILIGMSGSGRSLKKAFKVLLMHVS